MLRKRTKTILLAAAAILCAMQFYRPARTNPPSDAAASFQAVASPPPHVGAALARACHDCHSNQTVWPWYSRIAPVSWLIALDVKRGRTHLNLSEWDRYGAEASRTRVAEMCEQVRSGEMPLWYFTPLHPGARFDSRETASLCAMAGHVEEE